MICPLCTKVVPSSLLSIHMKSSHSASDHNSFKCKVHCCNRVFPTFVSFKSHSIKCWSKADRNASISSPACGSSNVTIEPIASTSKGNVSHHVCDEMVVENDDLLKSFECDVKACSDQFAAKLYAKSTLPRNHIQNVVHDVSAYISRCNGSLSELVLKTLKECSASQEQLDFIEKSFNVTLNSFSHLSTEYKRLQYFASSGAYIAPVSHKVGITNEPFKTGSGTVFKQKPHFVQSIPLGAVFKNFLELPDAYSEVCAYISSLENSSENVQNFMQCPHWKSKRSLHAATDMVLPIFVFCDDFECNNPLGSHSRSLGGTYVSLPCLPPECSSAIDNMFLALLFNTSYRKDFGDKNVFAPLINQLISLESDGITILTTDGPRKVYFVAGLLLGDNKGINSLAGFVEAFSANYFCRFCKTHRVDTQTQCKEDVHTLRTEASYMEDLLTANPTLTGVKFNSVFNDIPSFHVSSNFGVDGFHDFEEGVCHYVLLHLLNNCIPKYFSLAVLNNRIQFFDYGVCTSNKVPLLSEHFLTKKKIRMSGSEMLLFVKILGLLVGDLVPVTDLYWSLYIKLRQLLDICLSKHVSSRQSESLAVLVEEFNSMYISITKDTLKPKMHNLVHYPRVLYNSGPIELLSSKRFESKHRSLTAPAKATPSRVNPALTFATSHQLKQHFRFMSNLSIKPKTELGPCELVNVSDFENYLPYENLLPLSFIQHPSLCVDWIDLKGTRYKPGMVLIVNANEFGPVFGIIKCILIQNDVTVFVFNYLVSTGFCEHVYSYAVDFTDKCSAVNHNDLYDPHPLSAYSNVSGEKFLILKSQL